MTQTLTGRSIIKGNNLSGKNEYSQKSIPIDIKNLKIKIINSIILPLISRQWSQLYENMFFLETIKKKINFLYLPF